MDELLLLFTAMNFNPMMIPILIAGLLFFAIYFFIIRKKENFKNEKYGKYAKFFK